MEPRIPFKLNHNLHGVLIGAVVASVCYVALKKDAVTALAWGTATGTGLSAAMSTYGHPRIFDMGDKEDDDDDEDVAISQKGT